jgi:hypothetical protein
MNRAPSQRSVVTEAAVLVTERSPRDGRIFPGILRAGHCGHRGHREKSHIGECRTHPITRLFSCLLLIWFSEITAPSVSSVTRALVSKVYPVTEAFLSVTTQ